MAGRKSDFTLPTNAIDDLFSSQEERDEAKLKKIVEIPLALIDAFPGHPFKVVDDEEMEQLLLKTFSTEQKAMYDALDSAWVEASSIFDEAVFRRGVSLGVRITAESFLFER